MSPQPIERRKHPRRRVGVCAWLWFQGERTSRATVSHNLSRGGAMFSATRHVREGDPVVLSLDMGRADLPLECKARVCWTSVMPNGLCHFGVRFLDLAAEESALLDNLLANTEDGLQFATA